MRAARSSVVIAVAGRVAREREGHRRGLGDVGLPGARGGERDAEPQRWPPGSERARGVGSARDS